MRVGREFQATIPELKTSCKHLNLFFYQEVHSSRLLVLSSLVEELSADKGVGSILVWTPTDRLSNEDSKFANDITITSSSYTSRL